jgi:hypothetical protein
MLRLTHDDAAMHRMAASKLQMLQMLQMPGVGVKWRTCWAMVLQAALIIVLMQVCTDHRCADASMH